MPFKKKRNIIHSIRMEEELEDFLNKEADAKHLTFNNLVNSILQKHSEFGTFAEKFGFVTITKNTFQALVQSLNEEEMDVIARDISSLALKEFTFFKYNDPGVKSFLDFISILCNYGGLGLFQEKTQGLEHRITVRHNMGIKVTRLLGKIFVQTLKRIADLDIAVNDDSESEVAFIFRMDPFNL